MGSKLYRHVCVMKGSTLKGKKLLPKGADFIQKEIGEQDDGQEVTKLVFL